MREYRPPYLSVSQVTTYLGCPRKYKFRYIDKLEPEKRSAELALGSAVHSAIDWWMTERREGRSPTPEATQKLFAVDWLAQTATNEYDFEDSSPEEYRVLGNQLVALFLGRFAAESPAVNSEERFEVFLVNPRTGEPLPVPLVGVFDLVNEDGIGEIKTTARKSSPDAWGLQLAAYSLAWRATRGTKPRMRVIQLIKTKVPKIEVCDADITERDEAWFCEVAVGAYDSILLGAFHPVPGWMCGGCEYWKACRKAA